MIMRVDSTIFTAPLCSAPASTGVDHLYSVAALTSAGGGVVERYAYGAYGQRVVLNADGSLKEGAAIQNYGFTGQELDFEAGLWYFRARYFDDSLGRFVGRDPLGYVDGMSMYRGYFVPMGLDPSGRNDCTKTGRVLGKESRILTAMNVRVLLVQCRCETRCLTYDNRIRWEMARLYICSDIWLEAPVPRWVRVRTPDNDYNSQVTIETYIGIIGADFSGNSLPAVPDLPGSRVTAPPAGGPVAEMIGDNIIGPAVLPPTDIAWEKYNNYDCTEDCKP